MVPIGLLRYGSLSSGFSRSISEQNFYFVQKEQDKEKGESPANRPISADWHLLYDNYNKSPMSFAHGAFVLLIRVT